MASSCWMKVCLLTFTLIFFSFKFFFKCWNSELGLWFFFPPQTFWQNIILIIVTMIHQKKKNIGSDLVRTVQLVLLLSVVMMLTIKSTFIIRYAKAFTQSICIMTVTFQKVMVQLNVFTCTVVLGTTLVVCGWQLHYLLRMVVLYGWASLQPPLFVCVFGRGWSGEFIDLWIRTCTGFCCCCCFHLY